MWLIDQLAEARIAQAIERGTLDDLPGSGAPLDLDDNLLVPEELRVAYRILKNAGCIPPELELRREINQVEQLLATLHEPGQRTRAAKRLNLLMARLAATRGGEVDMRAFDNYYEKIAAQL
jgi:hypothetical protein